MRRLDVFGTRWAFQRLGLLVLAQLLHRAPRLVRVRLAPRTGPDAGPGPVPELLLLRLPAELDADSSYLELTLALESFLYAPARRDKHPFLWGAAAGDVYDLPAVSLTNAHDDGAGPGHDPVAMRGFGTLRGAARMAGLLLDLAQPSSALLEVDLECEAGFRGVAPASHQMRLVLPGAVVWRPTGFGHAG